MVGWMDWLEGTKKYRMERGTKKIWNENVRGVDSAESSGACVSFSFVCLVFI